MVAAMKSILSFLDHVQERRLINDVTIFNSSDSLQQHYIAITTDFISQIQRQTLYLQTSTTTPFNPSRNNNNATPKGVGSNKQDFSINTSTKRFGCRKRKIHTRITSHYNPSDRVIDLVCTYVVHINLICEWRDLQFNLDFRRQIF